MGRLKTCCRDRNLTSSMQPSYIRGRWLLPREKSDNVPLPEIRTYERGVGQKEKKIQPSFKWLITFLLGSRRHFKTICALTTQLCTPHSHCSSHLGVFSEWLEISYFRFFRMIFLSQAGIRSHSCDGDKQTWQLLTQQSTKIVCRLFPE